MSQPLKKEIIIGLFGKTAGTKLLNWLDPCCPQFCEAVNNCISYKSYIANLYENAVSYTSGSLVVGTEYVIFTVLGSDDFTNVGFSGTGIPFVATGTTPTVWSSFTVVYEVVASTPQATTLVNTTGINFTYQYIYQGVYSVVASSPVFSGCGMGCPPNQHTTIEITNPINIAYGGSLVSIFPVANDTMIIFTSDTLGSQYDNILGNLLQNTIKITLYP